MLEIYYEVQGMAPSITNKNPQRRKVDGVS